MLNGGVLLMKMGKLILSEWSNIGAVRAWDSDESTSRSLPCPLFGVRTTSKKPGLPRVANQRDAACGTWAVRGFGKRAAALLRDRLPSGLTAKDYMP